MSIWTRFNILIEKEDYLFNLFHTNIPDLKVADFKTWSNQVNNRILKGTHGTLVLPDKKNKFSTYLFEILRRVHEEHEELKKRYQALSRCIGEMDQFTDIRDSKQEVEESLPKMERAVNEAIMKVEKLSEVQNELLEDTKQVIRKRRRGR